MQQFLNDVGKLLRQRLAHLRARVFRRHVLADAYQFVERGQIPVVHILLLLLDNLQLLLRIVNQRAQRLLLRFPQRVSEDVVHLTLD